jgi:hypothetical protein
VTALGEESNGNLQGVHLNGDNLAKTSASNTWSGFLFSFSALHQFEMA